MTAEEFVSPDIDQLSVMAYLTYFRFIRDKRRKLPFLSAIGPGVTGAEIGEEVQLWIDGEEVEEEYVKVTVTGPDSSLIYVKEVPNRGASPLFIYKPTIVGTYRVEVRYAMEHLKGSPYIVRHTALLEAVTIGSGLHRACVGIEAKFTVDCSTLGKGILSALILGPDEEELDVVMGYALEGIYSVVYTPRATGNHTIYLEWDYQTESEDEVERDREVGEEEGEGEKEPSLAVTTLEATYTVIVFTTLEATYTVIVFDASKCIVIGDGLSRAFIGEPAYFQVRTGGAGKGSLTATMEGPDNPKVKLLMVKDGEYSYEYVPGEASYICELKWENFPIPGSPFKVTPTTKTAASRCVVKNRPADHVQVYKPVHTIVSVVDAEGSELMARVTGPNTNKDCNITEMETGIYTITICPTEVGEYCIHITLGTGCKIPESPLLFDVYDPSKCQVMNTDALVSNSWQCGGQVLVRVSTERAGKGTVEGEVEGPTQSDVCRRVEEGGGYTLLCFTPTETGQHTIEPTFEGHRFGDGIKTFVVDDSIEGIAITEPNSQVTPEPILLSWFQASLPQFHISNFTRDWSDGTKLSALVDYCQPGLIPNWDQKEPSKAAENVQNALSIAFKHFAIQEIIHMEDLATSRPDKLSVMTYLSYFCCPGSPGEKVLLEWVTTVNPEVEITNFTSDWKDGHALCSLVASFAPSAIDLDALDAHSDVKNTQIGMETAEEQFGIKPLMTAEEFVSPDIDQLSVMAYLTYFRFIRDERRKLPFLSAIGPGVTGAEIGEEVELWIDGEEVEEEYVKVTVTGPDSSLIYVKEVPHRGASPFFQYKPAIVGTYRVEVRYAMEHLKGSPYIVRHTALLDAVTIGSGLHRACVGIEAKFTVDCSTLGKGILSALILGPDEEELDVVMGYALEGIYSVVYTSRATGNHTIYLEWDYQTESEDEVERDREVGEEEGEGEKEPSLAVTTLEATYTVIVFTTLEATYTVIVFDASKCIVIGDGLSLELSSESQLTSR